MKILRFQWASQAVVRLHWLPVHQRILSKVLCITYKELQGQGPAFLREKLRRYVPNRTLGSRIWWCHTTSSPQLKTGIGFLWKLNLPPLSGISGSF